MKRMFILALAAGALSPFANTHADVPELTPGQVEQAKKILEASAAFRTRSAEEYATMQQSDISGFTIIKEGFPISAVSDKAVRQSLPNEGQLLLNSFDDLQIKSVGSPKGGMTSKILTKVGDKLEFPITASAFWKKKAIFRTEKNGPGFPLPLNGTIIGIGKVTYDPNLGLESGEISFQRFTFSNVYHEGDPLPPEGVTHVGLEALAADKAEIDKEALFKNVVAPLLQKRMVEKERQNQNILEKK